MEWGEMWQFSGSRREGYQMINHPKQVCLRWKTALKYWKHAVERSE